jgi:hypothetical protein
VERALLSDILSRVVRKDYERRPRHRRWRMETHWYQSLMVPLRSWGCEIVLAVFLGIATAFLTTRWLELFEEQFFSVLLLSGLIGFMPGLLTCAFLQGILGSAVAGAPPDVRFPASDVRGVMSTLRWLACLVAGPVPLLLGAVYYWIWCGDLDLIDWFILAELSFAAVGYGMFVLLAVTRSERLRDANPVRVAELLRGLGIRGAAFAVAAWLLVLVHGRLMLAVIQDVLQREGTAFSGWELLTLLWFSALFCATFLLRLLGRFSYRMLGPALLAA